ncbi:MAG: hypothetical protein K5657_02040 [Desulfovibrio sp.]|nr:hypothetical protein [Desulfovibrio sp.]
MNISSVNSQSYFSDLFTNDSEHEGNNGSAPIAPQDSISVTGFPEMTDEEVEGLMEETIQMISDDSGSALSVHSGLDPNRVFALLGLA